MKKENREFNIIQKVADFVGASYEATKQRFTRNKWKDEVSIKGFTFAILYQPVVITLLDKQFKINKEKNTFNLQEFKQTWQEIIHKYPKNQEYKDFYQFLQNYLTEHNDKFNLLDIKKKWSNQQEIWMCDTETTFTALVPPEFLFKDVKKGYGTNAKETTTNLHIQQITSKKDLLMYTIGERELVQKKGVKDWFKDNPDKKPYMWAWNSYNFVTKEYVILNYFDAVYYLNNYPKKVQHYYHNLSYDAYYVCNALIDEFGYQIIKEPTYEEKKVLKEDGKPWQQAKKTIVILANENKILTVKISNALGKIITMECTYLKTLASVDTVGKILNKQKLEINYMTPRPKNHVFIQQELDYIFTDVDIIVTYLNQIGESYKNRFNKKLKWLLTLGQTSFKMLKDLFGKPKWEKMFEFKFSQKEWNNLPKKEKEKYNNKRPSLLSAKESEYLRKGIYNPVNNSWSGGFYNGGYTNYNIKYVGVEHTNISSLDIKSSYPDKWQHYKMPYGGVIYDCLCNPLDFSNNSAHFKLYELEVFEDLKILPDKENMIPVKCEVEDENGKKVTNIEYYPWMLRGVYPLSQYMVKIFFILFAPQEHQYRLKKTMCFQHMVIKEFKQYDNLWQQEKETKELKKSNPSYYELCKLFLNGPTGKFGQKEIIEEKQFFINDKGAIDYKMVKTKEFEDLYKFSYLPVIIATTDISRLHLLSLIETVGWNAWHNSDTDSCKFWLPEWFKPEHNPTYMNLIVDKVETIYNAAGESVFGKWELEWTSRRFKCSGKKKYIYEKWENDKWDIKVVCAGAPQSVKDNMKFETFFVGYQTDENEKNKVDKLNGMPTILPTSFQIKNVFKSKNLVLMWRQSLLHGYYKEHLYRLNKLISESKQEVGKEFINYDNCVQDEIEKNKGVYS